MHDRFPGGVLPDGVFPGGVFPGGVFSGGVLPISILPIAVACFAALAMLPAQTQWQMQGGRMQASVVVSGQDYKRTTKVIAPGQQVAMQVGDSAVHFARNANGKPASLKMTTAAGARVNVAVDVAEQASPTVRVMTLFGDNAYVGALATKARELPFYVHTSGTEDAQLRDYRASVTVTKSDGCDTFGIVARHVADRGCYLFSIDWQARKIRLERWMGTHHMVVRQLDAPWLSSRHTLTLQVHGFRMQCSIDDEVVLHSFDGALTAGAPGVAWVGKRPTIGPLTVQPVADPLASAAIVQQRNRARLYASVPVAPGHFAVLQLSIDRPHVHVPRTLAGLESSLMQPPAAPMVLWGDWRNSLGDNSISEVGYDGQVIAEIVWPNLAGLRGQVALVQLLLVSPDGGAIVATTPAVALSF